MSEKYMVGEIVENRFGLHRAKADCHQPPLCEPLSWQDIAILLAARLRRAGIRVDGACVDADGWMFFWSERRPVNGEDQWTGAEWVRKQPNYSSISIPIGPQPNWRECLIEFPPEEKE